MTFLTSFDLADRLIRSTNSFRYFLARPITQNYFLLLVKIVAPTIFDHRPVTWDEVGSNKIENVFHQLSISKIFRSIAAKFVANMENIDAVF